MLCTMNLMRCGGCIQKNQFIILLLNLIAMESYKCILKIEAALAELIKLDFFNSIYVYCVTMCNIPITIALNRSVIDGMAA